MVKLPTYLLLVRPDLSAVVGWADIRYDRLSYHPHLCELTGYDTNGTKLFRRRGEENARRRAREIGMVLVSSFEFGLGSNRPEGVQSAAWALRWDR